MENKDLILYGAGGHAKVIADMAEGTAWTIKGVIDTNKGGEHLLAKYPIYLKPENLPLYGASRWVVAIGSNAIRKKVVEEELRGKPFGIIQDKTAIVSPYVQIGEGTVIMPAAVINVDARIGKHCIINTAASIDHDCVLGDYVHISPNASLAGSVSVGEGTHVGIGATVIQGIKIGRWCTIGAGAVIIRDVPDGCTVVGNPGKIIKQRNF